MEKDNDLKSKKKATISATKKRTTTKKASGVKEEKKADTKKKTTTKAKKTSNSKATTTRKRKVNEEEIIKREDLVIPVEEQTTVRESKKTNKVSLGMRIHFGTGFRISCYLVLVAVFLVLGVYFLINSYDFFEGDTVNYRESYNLDYKVLLSENNFYETNILDKNMTYVASLIDKIDILYDYDFEIDKDSDVRLTYYTYATLSITDDNGGSIFSKDYQLSEPEEVLVNSSKKANISKRVNIDYKYYNSLANQFRIAYGLNTSSHLKVYLKIMKTNLSKNTTINFVESDPFALDIPLSENTLSIGMEYNPVKENHEVISRPIYNVVNKRNLIISVCSFVLVLCILAFLFRFLVKIQVKKSEYDRLVEKILREYDREIVNTTSKPNLNSEKVIKVTDFTELLDARETLQLPIMYYEVNRHQKCHFYIDQGNSIYLLTIKAVDLDDK